MALSTWPVSKYPAALLSRVRHPSRSIVGWLTPAQGMYAAYPLALTLPAGVGYFGAREPPHLHVHPRSFLVFAPPGKQRGNSPGGYVQQYTTPKPKVVPQAQRSEDCKAWSTRDNAVWIAVITIVPSRPLWAYSSLRSSLYCLWSC